MLNSKIIRALLFAASLAASGSTYASVTTIYNFGSLLTGDVPSSLPDSFASAPFAQLQATENGGGVWVFTLTINNNLFSSFGSNAFLGSMTFDFTPDPSMSKPPTTFLGSNVGGVTSVKVIDGTGLSGLTDIDFGTAFGQGAGNRLSQNDWVRWGVAGLGSSSLSNMYIHVQGIGSQGYSAKYTPIMAVPEPYAYMMLLAGLGVLGFSVRRKHINT